MINLLDTFRAHPLVAILRAPDASRFVAAAEVICAAGIANLEFTLTTPGALDALTTARKSLPDDVLLGVGTVRTEQQVHDSIDAGASFLVSQIFRPGLVNAARSRDVPFVPGALTPAEVVTAWEAGVPAVKISPIGPVGGLNYLSELRAPLPEIPMLPTGGVELHEAGAYLRGGAVAVGLSRHLLHDALHPGGDLTGLGERASRALAAVNASGSTIVNEKGDA